MSFFETAKGNKRKGQPKGARLAYDDLKSASLPRLKKELALLMKIKAQYISFGSWEGGLERGKYHATHQSVLHKRILKLEREIKRRKK
jgi:hypothetical protein